MADYVISLLKHEMRLDLTQGRKFEREREGRDAERERERGWGGGGGGNAEREKGGQGRESQQETILRTTKPGSLSPVSKLIV